VIACRTLCGTLCGTLFEPHRGTLCRTLYGTLCGALFRALPLTLLAAALLGSVGCVNQTVKSTSVPALQAPAGSVPEAELLDVSVAIFDPGIDVVDEEERMYPEVRRAEARFVPEMLAEVLQNSGAWGAVRVVPDANRIADLMLTGTILHSDGEELKLQITARDSRGYVWLDKTYVGNASRYAYDSMTRASYDPFQALYHAIANDLVQRFDTVRGPR
jgi:hypothetical protein